MILFGLFLIFAFFAIFPNLLTGIRLFFVSIKIGEYGQALVFALLTVFLGVLLFLILERAGAFAIILKHVSL